MLLFRLAAFLLVLLATPAMSQVPEDPAARMTWLQEAEHRVLMRRDSWRAAENRYREPLWIAGDSGYAVVEGEQIFDNIATLIELSVAIGIDKALGPDMPSFLKDVARRVAGQRAEKVRAAVVDAYRKHSRSVKAQALAETETLLSAIREAFVETQTKRDGRHTDRGAPDARQKLGGDCPTRRCGGPYSASRPKCLAFGNGSGSCPPGYRNKDRYGCCRGW